MRAPFSARRRGGVTLLNAIVLCGLSVFTLSLVLPACFRARHGSGGGRQNTCRSNLSNLAIAMLLYDGRHGHLPGYMNALPRSDGSLYEDPDTGRPTAVSWCVEVLSDLDRGALYEEWQSIPARHSAASPSSTAAVPTTAAASNYRSVYLEILTCPSASGSRSVPMLNYVVNTGLPDVARAVPDIDGKPGTPRDWQANGMFFDNYTESKLAKPDPAVRAPQVIMSFSRLRDPKDKTILLTENADAGPYALLDLESLETNGTRNEIAWGCVWSPGPITIVDGKPAMSPGDGTFAPNVGTGGSRRPTDFRFARPSSHHPGGFNVAFAGKNVSFMSEKISYYIYAKLMASDDANAKLPGSEEFVDQRFRSRAVTDEDLNP